MKAAAAFDAFSNVTHGFAALLIGNCFKDVVITTVNISQRSYPIHRRVPNSDTSSTSYGAHVEEPAEIVPSAIDLTTGGTGSNAWIAVFMMITTLSTVLCACVGVRCIQNGYYRTAASYANEHEKELDHRVKRVDGSELDTPKVRSKENHMFSSLQSRTSASSSGGGRRMTAREKRAALNARNAPRLHGIGEDTIDRSGIFSNVPATSSTEEVKEGVNNNDSIFWDKKSGHAPRLSMLDFGKTLDEDNGDDSEAAAEFWRGRNRTGGNDP